MVASEAKRSAAALVPNEGTKVNDKHDDAVARSAIDTVARRLIMRRATDDDINHYLHEFVDINNADWERVVKRAWQLTKEIDHGQKTFEAAYKFLSGEVTFTRTVEVELDG